MGDGPSKQKRRSNSRDGNASRSKVSFGDYVFIRLELNTDDKEDFHEWVSSIGNAVEALDYFLDEGYKVSLSVDNNGGGVLCSVSQPYADHENAGCILTGRGGNAATAIAVVVYKDMVVAKGGSWRQAEHERGQSRLDIG